MALIEHRFLSEKWRQKYEVATMLVSGRKIDVENTTL